MFWIAIVAIVGAMIVLRIVRCFIFLVIIRRGVFFTYYLLAQLGQLGRRGSYAWWGLACCYSEVYRSEVFGSLYLAALGSLCLAVCLAVFDKPCRLCVPA